MEPGDVFALLIIIVGCLLAAALYCAGIFIRKRLACRKNGILRMIIAAFGIPAVLFIIIISIYFSLGYFTAIPEIVKKILGSIYVQVFFIILGGIILSFFIKNLLHIYEKNIASRTESDFDDKLIHFLQNVYGYVLWIGVGFYLLTVLKIDITPLLATGGLIGIVVGLAAQDTFGNFFSGAMIAADQPFRQGDRIEIQGVIGDVISVGPRSTRIRTLDSQLLTVPNKILTENMLTNYALPDICQKIRINIGVGYESDIELVRYVLLSVAGQAVREDCILSSPPPKVYFLDFGPSALMFQLLVWCDRYDQTFEVRDFLNSRIYSAFKSEGIEIPYPQMDVNLKNPDLLFKQL
jgi:small-conductance mechanosensitive channel